MITVKDLGAYRGIMVFDRYDQSSLLCHIERSDGSREYGYKFPDTLAGCEYAHQHSLRWMGPAAQD